VLERILNRDISAPFETTGEDRISKLTSKANRIVDMCVSEVTQTKEEKETIQGFISDMSHQMKTPLAGISMYADLLLDGNLSADEQREFLSRMKSGTEKLQWMMDSLIKMSRLEVGAIMLSPASENIKPTISDAIGSVVAAAAKKNVNISVSDFEDTPLYHDKKWTREAMANVLENAVKYSESDAEIEISVEPLPLYTKVIITDHGIGVEKADWNFIFKRFYRGQNVKNNEGAGLGLYLAALIMEKQGGYIMVDSIPGKFTSFSFFLRNGKR
jgi:signal transduction histidine kinase